MTIAPSEPSLQDIAEQPSKAAADAPQASVAGRRRRAWVAIGSHSAVDFVSFVPIALMPVLRQHAQLGDGQVAAIIATHAVSSGAIQPAVAWLSDRYDSRLIGAVGVLAAGLGVAGLVLAESFGALLALTVLTAGGVGAFHPPAAAAVGSLAGTARARWVSLFFVAGMIGGIAGNVLSPGIERAVGLAGLGWLLVPALLVAIALWAAIRRVPHRASGAHEVHASLSQRERRARWGSVGLLYASSVLRFAVNNALIFLMIVLLERRVVAEAGGAALTEELAERASTVNGFMQAAMQVGMGGGGLLLGWFLSRRHEKLALVLTSLVGAAALLVVPRVGDHTAALFAVTVAAGIGFGSMIPIKMSIAQRLLPHRTSLASALMLGGAWMFAGIGALVAQRVDAAMGLNAAFTLVAGALVFAGMLALFLPRKLLQSLDH